MKKKKICVLHKVLKKEENLGIKNLLPTALPFFRREGTPKSIDKENKKWYNEKVTPKQEE